MVWEGFFFFMKFKTNLEIALQHLQGCVVKSLNQSFQLNQWSIPGQAVKQSKAKGRSLRNLLVSVQRRHWGSGKVKAPVMSWVGMSSVGFPLLFPQELRSDSSQSCISRGISCVLKSVSSFLPSQRLYDVSILHTKSQRFSEPPLSVSGCNFLPMLEGTGLLVCNDHCSIQALIVCSPPFFIYPLIVYLGRKDGVWNMRIQVTLSLP